MAIIEKLSTITTVPTNTYDHLNDVLNMVHSQDTFAQILEGKNPVEIETFEGTIYISRNDDTLQYKFVPNEAFIKVITDTYVNNKSYLIRVASDKLKRTLINTYKDIL